ncbi:MAG: TM1812 family CRISPR-associated protein [Bacteroidales bacterium]|nr:TM1812 family CRISPR-associated protein [Bacteroidales bacterium]
MNILIANISIFQSRIQNIKYSINVDGKDMYFEARHTNESILNGIQKLFKSEKKLDKIIALCSNAVLETRSKSAEYSDIYNITAWEYYQDVAKKLFEDIDIKIVNLENINNQDRPNGEILNEICENISSGDNIYIDVAGGQRTTTNIIQLLTKILKYKGVNNPFSFYSNIQRNELGKIEKGTIENTNDFERLTNIADAVNEFVTTGKAIQFSKYYLALKDNDINCLLNFMTEFSDKIRLGNIENLDDTILNIKKYIQIIKLSKSQQIEYVILKNLLSLIEEKLIGNSTKIDYPQIISWCVDNGLIQQALAVFVEKMPVYMYGQGYYKYNGDVNDFAQNGSPILSKDFETNMFYIGVFDNISYDNDILQLYKSDVLDKVKTKEDLISRTKSFCDRHSINSVDIREIVKQFFTDKKLTNDPKLINAIANNLAFQKKLLGLKTDEKKATLDKKLDLALQVENGKVLPNKFSINITNTDLSKMMFAYLYAKQMRNKISHSSSDDNFSKEQIIILEKRGYIFEKYNIETLSKNIRFALSQMKVQKIS